MRDRLDSRICCVDSNLFPGEFPEAAKGPTSATLYDALDCGTSAGNALAFGSAQSRRGTIGVFSCAAGESLSLVDLFVCRWEGGLERTQLAAELRATRSFCSVSDCPGLERLASPLRFALVSALFSALFSSGCALVSALTMRRAASAFMRYLSAIAVAAIVVGWPASASATAASTSSAIRKCSAAWLRSASTIRDGGGAGAFGVESPETCSIFAG